MIRENAMITFSRKIASIAALAIILASPVFAQQSDPHKLVQAATDSILAEVELAKEYYDTTPEKLNNKVLEVLDPVVDFYGFTRNVMGKYASSKAYRALKTKQERAAFKARVDQFHPILRSTLIATYGKGLMAFSGEKVELLAPTDTDKEKINSGDSVLLTQKITAQDGAVYTLRYKSRPNKKGQWQVRNLYIENLDLGRVYRSQFAAAVRDNGGDVQAAIAAWKTTAHADVGKAKISDVER